MGTVRKRQVLPILVIDVVPVRNNFAVVRRQLAELKSELAELAKQAERLAGRAREISDRLVPIWGTGTVVVAAFAAAVGSALCSQAKQSADGNQET